MNIEIQALEYRYKKSSDYVFRDLHFSANPGITLIKGFSGCGKSTLLRLISGLLKPTKGLITTSSPFKVGSPQFLKKEVGIVFQQLNLLPLATIERNISLAVEMAGQDKSQITHWLNLLGLSSYRKKTPLELSGGQQQRASIARALAKSPTILLLDEPTSGLDDLNTQIITNSIKTSLLGDSLCIIATHDQRLDNIAHDIMDFNSFLPVEEHLQALV